MIAATVLSAGDSTRMGSPKALLELGGETFLHTILGKLRDAEIRSGYVVVGRDGDKILQSSDLGAFQAIQSDEVEAGPVGSIKSVLRRVSAEVQGLLIWPVDMPHVEIRTVQALMNAETDRPVIIPTWSERRGHPVIFKREIFREILQLETGLTARDVVRSNPARVHRVLVDDPSIVQSINTPEDYRRLLNAG